MQLGQILCISWLYLGLLGGLMAQSRLDNLEQLAKQQYKDKAYLKPMAVQRANTGLSRWTTWRACTAVGKNQP